MSKIIYIISFFVYSGYYAGLAIIFSVGLKELSRFYSLPLRILLSLLMVIVIMRHKQNFRKKKYSHFLFLFLAFWFFYILKVLYTESNFPNADLGRAWYEYIFYAITYVVLPFLTFYFLDFEKYKTIILNGFITSGLILGAASTYLYGSFLGSGIRLNHITYLTGEEVLSPLSLSYSGALTIALCVYRFWHETEINKLEKFYLFSAIGFSFIMFLLGSSRGSVVALVLSIPLFLIFSNLKKKVQYIFGYIISVPIIIYGIEASGSALSERMSNTTQDKGGGRTELWQSAISHFIDYPIFGGKIEIGGIYPHNVIIEILMATGLVGSMLIFPVLLKGFTEGLKITKLNNSNLFIMIIMIQGLAQHLFTGGFYTSILLFAPIALVLNSSNNGI